MSALLFENPWPFAIGGGLLTVALLAGFYHTSRIGMLWAAIAVLLLTAGAWVLEQYVVTERELVEEELYATTRDMERNDVQAVLARISPQAIEMRRNVAARMPAVRFEKVTIKDNLKIDVDMNQPEPVAVARFNCTVTLTGELVGTYPLFFTIRLHKEEGRWRYTSYEVDVRAGMPKEQPQ